MMRKLTASILGTAVLAGGALTGIAAAAPSHHHQTRTELQSRDHTQRDHTQHRETSHHHAEHGR